MQLFIFSVSKTFYSVSIYIFIHFLKNYIHFNRHKVNPIFRLAFSSARDLAILLLEVKSGLTISVKSWFCGKTFDSACIILFGLLLHVLFVWVSFVNAHKVWRALCCTVIIYKRGARLHLSSSNSSSTCAVSLRWITVCVISRDL